jgi:hypothetical protein
MTRAVADQLLDAQVAHILHALTGPSAAASVRRDVDELWAAASTIRLDELITADEVTRIATQLLASIPASVTVSTVLERWTDVVLDGPPVATTPSDLIDRGHVESLLDEAQHARRALADAQLDRLAESPQVGALASTFITRIVVEAVQANRAVAERIPGVGSIMSLGTSAASRVAGVADKPLQVMGDTAGRGAAMAVRRLRKVVLETLDDPVFAAAVMEVWDLRADEPLGGVTDEDGRGVVHRLAGLVQQIAIEAADTDQVRAAVGSFVTAFFEVYGEHPPTVLLEELSIDLETVTAELEVLLPRATARLHAGGALESAIRARLTPFFHSPAVAAILDGPA